MIVTSHPYPGGCLGQDPPEVTDRAVAECWQCPLCSSENTSSLGEGTEREGRTPSSAKSTPRVTASSKGEVAVGAEPGMGTLWLQLLPLPGLFNGLILTIIH